MSNSGQSDKSNFDHQISQHNRAKKISNLNDYHKAYDIETFIKDLLAYFDNQVDFNLDKIRQEISKPQRLEKIIKKASEKNTHPVVEFLQELFEDLGQNGDVKWSGEW